MANAIDNFLTGEKARESSREGVVIGDSGRHSIFPDDALGTREEVLEQSVLVTELNVNRAITQTRSAASLINSVDASSCLLGISHRLELRIALHCLSSGTFHYDMDCTALLRSNKACLTT